ncbi:hypothetical protein EYZ11_007861 [Aspergillus tanneri]|uniref:Uncharacterized protein n=1 Tax=Aspergillus tanneri TaxID=1220188 RepID=A0A4S3JBX4_9EURO|nr:hypothetical protein EYZ11_007861 [Aspergillus tanneri]
MFASKKVEQLIAEGGEFMIDLSQKLARRLTVIGIDAQSLEEQIDELQVKVMNLTTEPKFRLNSYIN